MKLKLELPVPTSINALYINQFIYNPRSRRREPSGAKILSKEGEDCKKEIQDMAREQMSGQEWDYEWTEDKDNFMYMDVIIYFSRRGRDADNIFKLLSDSLEKLVYDNDSRILPRVQKVLFDTENPHIEVEFTPVGYKGIFKDEEEASNFEESCKSCTRYRKGRCSILVDSLAGTVRSEIDFSHEFKCIEYKERR